MKAEFWHNRWEKREIGFHLNEVNPYLIQYFDTLAITRGGRVLVPLCGKTHDIGWLLEQGVEVVGAELSEQAVIELFENLNVEPEVIQKESFKLYQAPYLDVWVGDIFELTSEAIGKVNAVYDRAALVALPKEMRERYAKQIVSLTNTSPQLLITFEYNQQLMDGPPFSVDESEVKRLYENNYNSRKLGDEPVEGSLKGKVPASNVVYILNPNTTL